MQIYFHSRLCSYLSRVPILVEGTVYKIIYVYIYIYIYIYIQYILYIIRISIYLSIYLTFYASSSHPCYGFIHQDLLHFRFGPLGLFLALVHPSD